MADEPAAGAEADTAHNEDTEMAEAEAEVGPDVTIEEAPHDESEEHEADRSAVLVGEEDAGEDDVAEDFIDADDLAHDVSLLYVLVGCANVECKGLPRELVRIYHMRN